MKPEVWALIGVGVGALLGGLAQVLNAVVQNGLTRRRELRQWRVDAYRKYLRQIDELTIAHDTFAYALERSESREEILSEVGAMKKALVEFGDGAMAVECFGSRRVRRAINEIDDRISRVSATDFNGDTDALQKTFREIYDYRRIALGAMRRDLGVRR